MVTNECHASPRAIDAKRKRLTMAQCYFLLNSELLYARIGRTDNLNLRKIIVVLYIVVYNMAFYGSATVLPYYSTGIHSTVVRYKLKVKL